MLSDTVIRGAKPRDRPYKLTDGCSLYLFGELQWRAMLAVQIPDRQG